VALDVEAIVLDPLRAHGVVDHLLAEARVLQQLVGDALAQRASSVRRGRSSHTPTIIIRLTSLSMRSQAWSTRLMRSAVAK
jgi:F420-0:gamma-glutamyl ligase